MIENNSTQSGVVQTETGSYEPASPSSETIDALEKLDAQSEKTKKKLKHKIQIRNFTIIALLIIIIILLLKGCGSTEVALNWLKSPTIATTVDYKDNTDIERDFSHVDIFVTSNVTVNEDNPNMYLANPSSNKDRFYLQFELYEVGSDSYFYQSDLVEATDEDAVIAIDLYNMLEKGEYKVKVVTKAYFCDTLEQTTGGSQTITAFVQ